MSDPPLSDTDFKNKMASVLFLSRFCPDVPENRVRCLSAVRNFVKNAVGCLSVKISSVSIQPAARILSGF